MRTKNPTIIFEFLVNDSFVEYHGKSQFPGDSSNVTSLGPLSRWVFVTLKQNLSKRSHEQKPSPKRSRFGHAELPGSIDRKK